MLNIELKENGDIVLSGRFDASQVEKAQEVLEPLARSVSIDLEKLDYISSAGLGIFIATYKRLSDQGHKMVLKNVSQYVLNVFQLSRLDKVFEIE